MWPSAGQTGSTRARPVKNSAGPAADACVPARVICCAARAWSLDCVMAPTDPRPSTMKTRDVADACRTGLAPGRLLSRTKPRLAPSSGT